jgi:hypothetical protein
MKKKDLLKRIEELEKIIQKHYLVEMMKGDEQLGLYKQPCPTAEKFKAIADHANAINEVIQNAPKDDTIYVPDGILDVNMEIINGNTALFYNNEVWNAISYHNIIPSSPNQFKLVLCKREDLKAGDVAFVYLNEGNVDVKYEVSNLENYMIVTDKGIVFWDCSSGGISVINNKLNGNHVWYKIVEA